MTPEQLSKLKELKDLLDKGILTKEEVEQEKKRILQSDDASLPEQPSKQVEAEPRIQNRPESDKDAAKKRIVRICAAILLLFVCILMLLGKRNVEKMQRMAEPESEQVEDLFTGNTAKTNGHIGVDLGLPSGVKWATCNIGASSPEEYGDYFAWGETEPKSLYALENNKYCLSVDDDFTYNFSKYSLMYGGDKKSRLDLSDDAAQSNWGGKWRIPTAEEIKELKEKCSWERSAIDDIWGIRITGPNGNSIFLPAAGLRGGRFLYDSETDGYYLSSSLGSEDCFVLGLFFRWSQVDISDSIGRGDGCSIRPVCN